MDYEERFELLKKGFIGEYTPIKTITFNSCGQRYYILTFKIKSINLALIERKIKKSKLKLHYIHVEKGKLRLEFI